MKKLLIVIPLFLLLTCSKDKKNHGEEVNASCYPSEVATILINKCATAGCHNTQSAGEANGLDYSTWDNMFRGGFNGNSVIPYAVDESYMLYFVNTDSTIGLVTKPTMPYNTTTLSKTEYLTLRDWIARGAPNCNGFIKFSDNPNQKKVYVCMSGCDKVAVLDAETHVVMRYVSVGINPAQNENPHQVRITPDGKYWAVVFYNSSVVQFFNTSDDTHVADINIGHGNWNSIAFTHDSKIGFVSDLAGSVREVNIASFSAGSYIGFPQSHGLYVTKNDSFLYITGQTANIVSVYQISDNSTSAFSVSGQPHEMAFTEDESMFFVSCQSSDQVKVFRTSDNALLSTFHVGHVPQELSLSKNHPYLYVTCMEDVNSTVPGWVYRINYQTLQIVDSLEMGAHCHGIAVDDDHDVVYVANINQSSGSVHHPSSCGGTNGFISIIDMKKNPMALLNVNLPDGSSYIYKNEVLPSPYFVAYRK